MGTCKSQTQHFRLKSSKLSIIDLFPVLVNDILSEQNGGHVTHASILRRAENLNKGLDAVLAFGELVSSICLKEHGY